MQDKSGNSFPAQEPMVEQLLAQLTQPWKRIATPPDPDSLEGKKTLASMGLTTPQLTVSIRALNQPEPITIHLGAHLDEATSMYASSSDFRNVGLAPWDTYRLANQPVHAWINRQFAPVIPASVTSIEVQSNQGNTSLIRDAVTGIWQVVDPIIDTADHLAIETHLVELSRSTALEYRGEADTFDTEFALKLTIHQAPDVTRELIWEKIHRPPDDPAEAGEPDLFLVHDKSSPYRAIVTGEAVEDWSLSSDHFRDRRMLLFSQSSIQKVQIDIFGKSGFSIEKSSGEQWQILGDNISTPIPADSGQVADFLNLAQSLRISSFPDIPWDQASSIGLAPPRASYSFWSQPTTQQDPVMIAQLNLGSLDTEREILYAAHNRTNRIHTLSPVHALSLPREYFPLRSRKLLPGILSTQITRLSWSGQSGEIQLTRNPNGTWANLDPIESETIIDFCADLAGFEVDSWRTFGIDALKNLILILTMRIN
ncbi:MAG: DUF4340 domain-containing protein [Verrucomicrobia bacterium]|nr:DUF4340 domain-containing protein [Verrucomicrobiota bacterium]